MVIRAVTSERRDYYLGPAADEETERVLDEAVASLAVARNMGSGGAGVELHLLVSLLAEAESRLARAVGVARDCGYSWAQVADLLGVTRASAWQRYARRTERSPGEE
jgi:hypothetical protein